MRRFLWIILSVLCLCSLILPAVGCGGNAGDADMSQLDSVISRRPEYLRAKEKQLQRLHDDVSAAADGRERFDALGALFDAYHAFNADSAYDITFRQEAIARHIGDEAMLINARMNRAGILSATGMYRETLEIMDSIHLATLPDYLRPYYFHILRTVYGRLADFAAFGPEKERYSRLTDRFRDSLLAVNPPNTLFHELILADKLNVHGRPGEAIDTLYRYVSANNLSEHGQGHMRLDFRRIIRETR